MKVVVVHSFENKNFPLQCLNKQTLWHIYGIWMMLLINGIIKRHHIQLIFHFTSSILSCRAHYSDVMMGAIASQITNLATVYSTVYSDADQRKHQSSASLAFVRGIHRGPVNSPHKWPVTRKMFPFDDVIMGVIITIQTFHVISASLALITHMRTPLPLVLADHTAGSSKAS